MWYVFYGSEEFKDITNLGDDWCFVSQYFIYKILGFEKEAERIINKITEGEAKFVLQKSTDRVALREWVIHKHPLNFVASTSIWKIDYTTARKIDIDGSRLISESLFRFLTRYEHHHKNLFDE